MVILELLTGSDAECPYNRDMARSFMPERQQLFEAPLKAVLAELVGGLGNQMFQYAAARAVSMRCNAALILDASWLSSVTEQHFDLWPFRPQTARPFALSPFRIKAGILKSDQPRSRWNNGLHHFTDRLNKRFGARKLGAPVYREKSFQYDSRVKSLQAPVYMYGYFQSEKYFADCRDAILEDFEITEPPCPEAQTLLDRIKVSDAICVHIRRGDYVTNRNVNALHGLCSLDYYHRGLQHIATNLTRPECFVFSDEPAWVRENLKLDVPVTIVDIHGPDEAHGDLRLMAACHSYVIANSSLSWWGAWLGRRAGKRVVAPRQWFRAGRHDERDLIPDQWVRL